MKSIFKLKKFVTFYSYKGGVGRTMALSNIAWLLTKQHDKKVVIVDWDLEAPGLHRFFDLSDNDIKCKGLIDLMYDFKQLLKNKIEGEISDHIHLKDYLMDIK